MAKTKVVIIIPTYNEKGNVDKLIQHLVSKIFPELKSDYNMNVLVVDDSSPDGTADAVSDLRKKNKNVFLLVNIEKLGLGNAYTKGMEYALDKLKADVVFEFDADFSHDPNQISPMLQKISEGYDLVLGSRYISGGSIPSNWGLHRKFFSKVGNWVIRTILCNWSIKDWTTGYRAIKSKVVRVILPELNQEKFMGYTFQIGFLHNSVKKGFKVAEVPIHFKDRELGKSKLGSEYIKNTLKYILKVRLREIYTSRVFRFVVVGGVGALVQLSSLQLLRQSLPYQLAYFISVEFAVISNFIWSNLWTFADKKLAIQEIPYKFIQFNLASMGSIIIQQFVALIGENMIGLKTLFTLPVVGLEIDTGLVFALVGIFLGMTWNFMAYTKIIWRDKRK